VSTAVYPRKGSRVVITAQVSGIGGGLVEAFSKWDFDGAALALVWG
jgi:hypothetical protein